MTGLICVNFLLNNLFFSFEIYSFPSGIVSSVGLVYVCAIIFKYNKKSTSCYLMLEGNVAYRVSRRGSEICFPNDFSDLVGMKPALMFIESGCHGVGL